MSISKEYIRRRLKVSVLNDDVDVSQEYVSPKPPITAALKTFLKKHLPRKYRCKVKAMILSIPFLRNYLVKNKQKLLSMPIIKNIIAFLR